MLSALSHPNVVQVLDFFAGDDETPPYIVMERVLGRPLNEVVKDGGPLDEVHVAELGLQLADAISSAHAGGVVHRDVKPGNVILTETTLGRDAVKLLDFGVARDLHATHELTQDGAVVGTLAWLSPEQVLGAPADVQSDVYAIGATLYFCLFGRKPYPQADLDLDLDHLFAQCSRGTELLDRRAERLGAPDRGRRSASTSSLDAGFDLRR